MAKRKENSWQFKFSFALAAVMLFLIFGYFTQSFLEIRKVQPVRVAIERIKGPSTEADVKDEDAPIVEEGNKEASEQ